MRTLVWKELRENIRWALLGMLILGATEIYVLYGPRNEYGPSSYNTNDGITLCNTSFLTVTTFGCAAIGLLLGLLQVLPELKRDRWAALLHRPVPRGQFFWGKAAAGTLLYLLATGIPLIVSICVVATPGNFAAPFLPAMIRPGAMDLIAGLAYYFAGLLVALQGGSILLRILPLFATLHLSFAILDEELFRVALEASVAMIAVLCVAGWGAIYDRESIRLRPWISRIAILVVVFYGACGVGELVKMMGGIAGRMGSQVFYRWDILKDGQPALLKYEDDVVVASTDSHGRAFADTKNNPINIRRNISYLNTTTPYIGESHGWKPRFYRYSYRESSLYLWSYGNFEYPEPGQWFRLRKEQSCVGFHLADQREYATFGSLGFGLPGRHMPGFSEDIDLNEISGCLLAVQSRDSLRLVDLAAQTIIPLQLAAPPPIYGTSNTWIDLGNGSKSFLAVAFQTGMAAYEENGRLVAMLPYHHDVSRWGHLSLGAITQDSFILQYEPSEWIPGDQARKMPSYADLMDVHGNVLASYTMSPAPPDVNPPLWKDWIGYRLKSPALYAGELLYRRIGGMLGSKRLRDASTWDFGPHLQETLSVAIATTLVGLVLAIVTFFWAHRAHLTRAQVWGWTLLVFALALPGFVVFWLAGERPRTIACESCARPRRVDRRECGQCGAGWSRPAPTGTEIFEHSRSESPAASL